MSYLEMADKVSRQIEEYRAALWRCWQLMAAGADADQAEAIALYQKIVVLIDDLGPDSASRLRHMWEVEWFNKTGRCPRCGIHGERHQ